MLAFRAAKEAAAAQQRMFQEAEQQRDAAAAAALAEQNANTARADTARKVASWVPALQADAHSQHARHADS